MFPVHLHSFKTDDDVVIVTAETQGWRNSMEDFILNTQVQGLDGEEMDRIFGVFDGHGGFYVSLVCKVTFQKVLEHNIKVLKE